MVGGSGSPRTDAQFDFGRARRRQALEQLAARLRRLPDDVNTMLPFEDVVAAYGYVSERDLGLQLIDLDTIVGSVGRGQDFDRSFRPLTSRVRPRWERIAAAHRRGEAMPAIDVYRIGGLHFVRDGHHRVSVARQLGLDKIEAHVIEVITRVDAGDSVRLAQLPLFSHKRLFEERVPLPEEDRVAIKLTDEWRYAALAEGVEAWGFRAMQERQTWMSRAEVARAWFEDEYQPVVALLRDADLVGSGTETEAYIRIATLRYLLLQTHRWDDEVVERLRAELAKPRPAVDDTLVHRLRSELRSQS
jgi:hypothetical protein